MRTQQFIEFSNQVTGREPVRGAREATIVERLQQVLLTALFSPPGDTPAAGGLGLDFAACLNRFRAEMAFSADLKEPNRSLVAALGLFDADGASAESDAWVRAYVLGLHAIARAIATFRYQCQLGGVDEEREDNGDASNDPGLLPAPALLDAERPLAGWLCRFHARGAAKDEDTKAPQALARAIVRAAIATLDNHLRIVTRKARGHDGTPLTPDCIIASRDIDERLTRVFAAAPHAFTLQPLRAPVAYGEVPDAEPPAETTTSRDLVSWRLVSPFLRGFAKACHAPEFLGSMTEAVNLQQAVRWRINRRLMEWVRVMAWLDADPARRHRPPWLEKFSEPVRQAVAKINAWPPEGIQIRRLMSAGSRGVGDPDAPVILRQSQARQLTASTQRKRPAAQPTNPLDNPLVSSVFASLGLDEASADADAGKVFYLAWFADFRGRIYVDTPWFSPQGADVQRAMLEFADGQPLTESGRQALKRHGGGLARRKLILDDLGITDREVVTFDERERWIDAHVAPIRASAQNPLEHTFWFHASGDPLQFLAFCIEWDRQCENPAAPCHLPVQIDGSCSGLQHMAALTGSERLALAVNVKARADGLPGDIYNELAEAVRRGLAGTPGAPSSDNGQTVTATGKAADAVRTQAYELLRQKAEWITRETAKKVVMTVPYGAGTNSQAAHVLESLIDGLCPLAENEALEIETLGRTIIATLKYPPKAVDREIAVEWGLSRLAFYIALELRKALGEKYAAATEFERTVSRIGAAVLNNRTADGSVRSPTDGDSSKPRLPLQRMPLAWPAPSGLAVCQPGFASKRTAAEITMRGKPNKKFSVGFTEHLPQIDLAKQANSLMPNLIHCLDATHLNRTIRAIASQGVRSFGTIHDCIQCLPNDLQTIEKVLREQFATLYAPANDGSGLPKVLLDWYQWMCLLHDIVRLPDAKTFFRLVLPETTMAAGFMNAGVGSGMATLVARIKALPRAHRAILDCLADALADEPRPRATDLVKPRTMPATAEFSVPGETRLDVDAVLTSPYFFS